MKIHYIYTIILGALISVCTLSCDDDVNDWAVDPGYEAPFRPTGFEAKLNSATSVYLNYKGVTDASKYIFEFSEGDSLLFDNIVRTVEILADTLTVYNDHVAPTKREYRTLFEDLKGTERYSVRMKAIDKSNRETGYVRVCFDTPAEQVMYRYIITPNSITVYWDKEKEVNKICYGVYTEGEETTFETHIFTEAELNAGVVTLTGLTPGTSYDIQIMFDDQLRGSRRLQTTGKAGENVQHIAVNETTDINDLLTTQAGLGHKDIVLLFPLLESGATYEIGQINVPKGIDNLYLTGASTTPELPKLFLHAVRLNGPMQMISFQNISMDGRKNGSNFLFNIDNTENCFKNVHFMGCEISEIGRSLVYLRVGVDIDNIIINDCVISNVSGSYGVYNSGNQDVHVKLLSITNSTLTGIGDQLADVNGTHDMVVMDYITFCNYTTTNLGKLFRWRKEPGGMKMTNSIFTGTNADKTLDATADTKYLMDFTSCYKTNEWTWKTHAFTNITEVNMSGEELFVDPQNGDFHIKDGVRFAGANKAGDPRWWED